MRSKSNDFFSTILMLIPLVAVPMLAIFGIPEIAPVKKSPFNENEQANSEGFSGSQFEDISFDASADEIDLGSEGDFSQRSGPNQNRGETKSPFEKMASTQKGSFNEEEWLPPAGALEGWELETVPSKLEVDQKGIGLSSANSGRMSEQNLENKSIQQASFETEQASLESAGTFNQEILQVENEANPFEKVPPSRPAAVKPVDEQFRLRAEKMLRRDPVTWGAAVEKLNELGIRDYRLEPGGRPNEFLFSCSYSPPQNPRISRRFEAEALDPLKAVIQVLQQVDEWNRNK
ncbi:hypothetical protein [Gimesia aquarii]|uniref:Uncharacterized protein n=1 Tax=Gimesia aquarii TaxID=2527964 RepID=A0A517W321_9PLAN|nr:hypothetical protein [Gimesia aquarii]QDT99649.1 hypothetical protein V144x_51610 [Gimesia aquarii]